MIVQAILVSMMMLLYTGRCLELKPMPTCPARCGDLAIPSSYGAGDYYSCSLVNNSISRITFSEFSMSSTRNFDFYGLEKISEKWDGFPASVFDAVMSKLNSDSSSFELKIPVKDVLECPTANLSCLEVEKSDSSFELCATDTVYVDLSNPYLVDGFEYDGEIDGSVSHSLALTCSYGLYGIILVSTVPAIIISWLISFSKKKKAVKLRRDSFIRNGGKILEAKLSVQKTLSVFTAEDLKKATNNYDERNVLCEEDHLGIIYKGASLPGVNSGVTIHRCYAFDRCKIEILISKLVALSQLSHTNVVKLLGCCLETQVPLLVYEFLTSKTLLDYINDNSLSWDIRLKVAADTAGALAYLHSATTGPIIHGNLNSSCILLDHGNNVKVSGFALTCSDCASVQFHGDTSIYLDPDCFSYGQLTEKSDVYSFGFILAELLTGKGEMSPEWLQIEEKLAEFFAGSSGGGDLLGILDDRLVTGDNLGRLTQVAEIAKRCLSSSSHERPTMKEVAIQLECVLIS